MKTVAITDLKARLSAYLDRVRGGEEIGVTDRGRLIARLAPVEGAEHAESRRDLLLRTGQLKSPAAALPRDFHQKGAPADPAGRSLAALLEERSEGW
ncbi:MAG: type II toxin-antitoxin system prevent-host-death family antitoxin [Gemmatimonadetes bacterium]|nr:type II toxin-antitoxin system prevent-host-death family antitoxin [Gemmatimonadota bacterium]